MNAEKLLSNTSDRAQLLPVGLRLSADQTLYGAKAQRYAMARIGTLPRAIGVLRAPVHGWLYRVAWRTRHSERSAQGVQE